MMMMGLKRWRGREETAIDTGRLVIDVDVVVIVAASAAPPA